MLQKVLIHLQPTNHTENDIKTIRKAELAVESARE
jgi:hypothetical protein